MGIGQMEVLPAPHNHSVMGSLAKESGFPADKHKYKSHWCLAGEVTDPPVPSGILLCLTFFSSFVPL